MDANEDKYIIGPTNYECECECHTNTQYEHEGPCCFQCPNCKKNIQLHLYNEHVHTCKRQQRLDEKRKIDEEMAKLRGGNQKKDALSAPKREDPPSPDAKKSRRNWRNKVSSHETTRTRHRTRRSR